MLTRIREWLTVILVALLPLHAFIVTFKTKLLLGPGNAPLTALTLWKEVLLLVILGLAVIEIWRQWQRDPKQISEFDRIDAIVVCLFLLAAVVSVLTFQNVELMLYGVKYDLVPLFAFLILRRVSWSKEFTHNVLQALLLVGCVVALYGIAALFLPIGFFKVIGYSDLHSLYLPGGPLPAFHQIGETGLRRLQSTLSGPNQAGLWLLIPYCLALLFTLRRPDAHRAAMTLLIGVTLVLSFSRAAWVAAAVITFVSLRTHLSQKFPRHHIVSAGGIIVVALVIITVWEPSLILRFASSRDHMARPLAAIQRMIEQPWGTGLGTAGPASNRVSDVCVSVPAGADTSWAADRPDLCVFAGDEQVQPLDRECNCPFLPENWYLQIGVELGWIGMALFVGLILLVLSKLRAASRLRSESYAGLAEGIFLAMLGISLAALFLHAWEDSAVAYSIWILAATTTQLRARL